MVPKPPRGVDGAVGPLRGPTVVGAIEVEVGLDERALGNQERGDAGLLVLS